MIGSLDEFLDFADHNPRLELHLGTGKKSPNGWLVKTVSDQTVNQRRPISGSQTGKKQESSEA
jgi:hypothetical protein